MRPNDPSSRGGGAARNGRATDGLGRMTEKDLSLISHDHLGWLPIRGNDLNASADAGGVT